MEKKLPLESAMAYAAGYLDGRLFGGSEGNPYAADDPRRMAYDRGYEKGVSDYVELDECKRKCRPESE